MYNVICIFYVFYSRLNVFLNRFIYVLFYNNESLLLLPTRKIIKKSCELILCVNAFRNNDLLKASKEVKYCMLTTDDSDELRAKRGTFLLLNFAFRFEADGFFRHVGALPFPRASCCPCTLTDFVSSADSLRRRPQRRSTSI